MGRMEKEGRILDKIYSFVTRWQRGRMGRGRIFRGRPPCFRK